MTDRRATPRESRTSSSRDSRGTPRYSRLSSAASQDSRVDSPYSGRRTPDPFESSFGESPRPKTSTSRASTSSTSKATPAEPKGKSNVSLGSRNEGFASDRNDSYQDRNESYQSRNDSYQDRREDIVYKSRKDSSLSRRDSNQSRTDSYKESPQRKDSSRRRTTSISQRDSPATTFNVNVKTGDIRGAGTDSNVFLTIFGTKGDTGSQQLRQSENAWNKFERGNTDMFKVEAVDIGKIKKIKIGHDNSKLGAAWFLDEVRIDIPSQGEHYTFAAHRWLSEKEGDKQTEVELEPSHSVPARAPHSPDFPPAVIREVASRPHSPTDPEDVFHDSHSPSERMREEGLRTYQSQDRSGSNRSLSSESEQHPTVYLQEEMGDSHDAGSSFENDIGRIESGGQTVENADLDPSSTLGDLGMVTKVTKEPDQWRGLFYCLNTRKCSWAIVLLIFATWMPLLFMVEIGEVRRNITHDTQVMIGPQSKEWLYPKVDTAVAVYFFNVSNAADYDEATGGAGFVPSVTQVGPYYFKIGIRREKVTWNNANNTVTFATAPTFTFDSKRSCGSQLDKIVTANVPKITIEGAVAEYTAVITAFGLGLEDNSPMFEEHSVKELLWGYEPESFKTIVETLQGVNLFGVLDSVIESIPKTFGFFEGKNGTIGDILNVYTGKGDFSKFNKVHSANYVTKLPYWASEKANKIRGSDGTIFQPLLDKNTALEYFSTDMYRSFALEYVKPAKFKGMYTLRFVIPDSQLTNTTMADSEHVSDLIWGTVPSPSKWDPVADAENSRSKRDMLADSPNSRRKRDRSMFDSALLKAVDRFKQLNATDRETLIDMEEQAGSGDNDHREKLDELDPKFLLNESVPNAYKNFALLGHPLKHAHLGDARDAHDDNHQSMGGDAADDTGPDSDDTTNVRPGRMGAGAGAPRGGFCAPTCLPAGMYSLETVLKEQQGIAVPIFMSLPHYLGADPVYFQKVEGLTPDEDEHRPYFDVDTVTGVAMRQTRRFQLSVRLPGDDDLAMVPVFWVDTFIELNDKDAAKIKQAHAGYVTIETIRWLMLGLTVFSWVVLIGLCAFNRCRTYKNVTDIPDPDKGRPFRASYN